MPAKTKKIIRIISLVLILTLVLLISVAYIQYRDIKRAFVAKLSSEVTAFIGQDVAVGDISFSPSGEINLHTIIVHNPEGFKKGKLLTIKKLSLKMRYRDLLKKNLYFDRISIQKPELMISKDNEGRFNISDKLMNFISQKPTLQYQIDEFIIQSGIVNFNIDKRFRSDDVNLLIQNLSSEQDTKTTIRGQASYADSRIEINGWVYPKNEPKRLNISLSSQDVSLSALKDLLNKSGAEISKTKVTAFLNAEGDTAQGVNFSSEIRIRDAKFSFLKKDVKEIYLRIQAFLNIPDKTLVLEKTSLDAGGVTAITVNGELKEAKDDFLYAADVKIDKLNLSVMNFMKDVTMSGVINSEKLHVRGSVKKLFPELSGNMQLRDAQFQRRDVAVGRVNADMKFLPGKRATLDLIVKDVKYGSHTIPWLQGRSGIEYRDNIIHLKTTAVESQYFSASSNYAVIRLPQKNGEHGVRAEMRGLSASYPERKAGIRNVALSINVNKVSKVFTGTFDFVANEILFNDIRTGIVKGRGTFDGKKYSIDIAQADIAGGRIRLVAGGRTSGDMFPITLASSANNINLEYLSRDIAKISSISYPIAGNVTRAVFEGTINSVESVQGKASIQAEKVSIPVRDKQRAVIREGMVSADIVFKGNDLDIRADAGAGKLSADIVGTVKSFRNNHRSGELKIRMPEVKVADIRETFWDVFPDSMLYAGIEGFLASDLAVQYDGSSIGVKGTLRLNDVLLKGENGEYTLGPVNGIIPVAYGKGNNFQKSSFRKEGEGAVDGIHELFTLQSFERNTFRSLSTYYAQKAHDKSYSLITVGTVSYGFPLLEAINIWIKPEGKFLHIGHFSGNIFGGKLNGSAIIDLADAFQYKAGFHIEGISLTELCDSIEPIRGYITGKIDGIATVKGDGGGLSRLIGKADFWTYSTEKERTRISKEFLHKIGGPSLQRYLGDRTFDKGTMSLYLQNGFVIFRDLEISNRNFIGMKDLDIKVAPLSNRISLDHLMWSITEAAYRAQKKE